MIKENTPYSGKISKKQISDSGMAFVLIFLLIGFFTENLLYYKIAIPILIINMAFPILFYWPAIIWLGFSKVLGTIVSAILLSLIFFTLVTPIGLIRNLIGKDNLKLKKFKKTSGSFWVSRNYEFGSKDLIHPF